MKGHAKIELTNVKTGEVQIIEEDNIVTNLLTDLAQHRVLHLQDSFVTSRDRTLSNYDSENKNRSRTPFTEYGGLLMFKEQLEASETNYYPNGPATMVAHASDDAYTGTDLTRGSFNTNLSSYDINEGKVTLVWDFNMEQGNGTIGTVCLCNHVDGQIGYGSMYSSENTNLGKAPFYHHGSNYASGGPGMYISLSKSYPADISKAPNGFTGMHPCLGYVPVWLDTTSNKLVLMNQSYVAGNNLEFAVVDIDSSSVNPITITYNSNVSGGYYYFTNTRRKIEYVDIPLHLTDIAYSSTSFDSKYWGSGFSYIQMWSGLDFQGNFWFSSANRFYGASSTTANVSSRILTWTAGAVMRFTKLNLTTMETEEYEVTNTTGANITMNCGFASDDAGWLTSLCEFHGYLLIRGDNAHLYAINLSNNSDVHEVVYADGTPVTVYKNNSYECNGTAYGNGSIAAHRGWAVNRIGGFLIINANGGAFNTTTDGNLIIIGPDFVARKLSSPSIAQFLNMASSGTSQQTYNSSGYPVFCNSDTPLCLCVYYAYNSGYSDSGVPTITWTETAKNMTANVYIYRFTYKPMGLITINTLAEPVTKTADMTMRITYTLTT